MVRCVWLIAFGALVNSMQLTECRADERVVSSEQDKPVSRDLRVGSVRVNRVLFLGNSITLHGPLAKIGWDGNWGMAASALEKDYVHLLTGQIEKAAGGRPEVKVKNIAEFERRMDAFHLKEGLKDELAFEADLIIVAIGENVPALKTDSAKEQFKTSFGALLAELKKRGNPTLIVRSQFWADATKDERMKQCCEDAGGVFVDIGQLGKVEANYARSEQKIEHAGVAGHPGDRGMQALADELWKAIRAHGDKK